VKLGSSSDGEATISPRTAPGGEGMRAEKSIYEEMVEKYGDEVPDSVRLLGRRRPTEAEFRYGKTLELRARELIAQHSTHGPQGVRDERGRRWMIYS